MSKIFGVISGTISDIGISGGFNTTLGYISELKNHVKKLEPYFDIAEDCLPPARSEHNTYKLVIKCLDKKRYLILSSYIGINPNNGKQNRGAFLSYSVITCGYVDDTFFGKLISYLDDNIQRIKDELFDETHCSFIKSVKSLDDITKGKTDWLIPHDATTIHSECASISNNEANKTYIYLDDFYKDLDTKNINEYKKKVSLIYSELRKIGDKDIDLIIVPSYFREKNEIKGRSNIIPDKSSQKEAVKPKSMPKNMALPYNNYPDRPNYSPERIQLSKNSLISELDELLNSHKQAESSINRIKSALIYDSNNIKPTQKNQNILDDILIFLGNWRNLAVIVPVIMIIALSLAMISQSPPDTQNQGGIEAQHAINKPTVFERIKNGKKFIILLDPNDKDIGCDLDKDKQAKDSSPLMGLRSGSIYTVFFSENIWTVTGLNQAKAHCTDATVSLPAESDRDDIINVWGLEFVVNENKILQYKDKEIGKVEFLDD